MVTQVQEADRRWKNQPVIRERDPRRVRALWWLMVGIVVALAPVAVFVWLQMQFVDVHYEIQNLQDAIEELERAEHRLRSDRARMSAPARVESNTRRLGLVRPEPDQVVMVEAGSPALEDLLARAPDDEGAAR